MSPSPVPLTPLAHGLGLPTQPHRMLQQMLAHTAHAVWVKVATVQGSAPREVGAWMAVYLDANQQPQLIGTIGGGHLEWQAVQQAQQMLQTGSAQATSPETPPSASANATGTSTATNIVERRFALGPSLGQCCGGVVVLRFEAITLADWPRLEPLLTHRLQPMALFGGGHVGHAIVRALCPLPFAIQWVDSREGVFPSGLPDHITTQHAELVHDAVADIAPQSMVLIMSFSHAEDLDITAAALMRQRRHGDLPFIGLIGSQSKWARFAHRLQERGFSDAELAHVTCPIGIEGIQGKAPAVIAASVAAQLLQIMDAN